MTFIGKYSPSGQRSKNSSPRLNLRFPLGVCAHACAQKDLSAWQVQKAAFPESETYGVWARRIWGEGKGNFIASFLSGHLCRNTPETDSFSAKNEELLVR